MKLYTLYILLLITTLLPAIGYADSVNRITPNNSSSTLSTLDPGNTQDKLFIFSSEKGGADGSLSISLSNNETIKWEFVAPGTSSKVVIKEEIAQESKVSGLQNGGYFVTYSITDGTTITTQTDYAYVQNSWIITSGTISDSDCDGFQLNGSIVEEASTLYYTRDGEAKERYKLYEYSWTGLEFDTSVESSYNSNPPPTDETYTFTVSDINSGCSGSSEVLYLSKVAESSFDWSHTQDLTGSLPEAPLDVTFINNSVNGDFFEWFLFKDSDLLIEEGASSEAVVDSFLVILEGDFPTYRYENSGSYNVKLVASRIDEDGTVCQDTSYLISPIEIDTSMVQVMEVFTPNGDGKNDLLLVKTISLQQLDFFIFNRWGKRVHSYSKKGFIPEDAELATWDGKSGGKVLPTGVYFYVANAVGRDGTRKKEKGTIHLFK